MILLSRIGTLFVSLAIIYLSNQPGTGAPPDFPHQDKLFHFLAYFSLGLFARLGWQWFKKSHFLFFGALFALSDEIHQYFIPLRSCDPLDWIADMLGLVAALYFVELTVFLLSKRRMQG